MRQFQTEPQPLACGANPSAYKQVGCCHSNTRKQKHFFQKLINRKYNIKTGREKWLKAFRVTEITEVFLRNVFMKDIKMWLNLWCNVFKSNCRKRYTMKNRIKIILNIFIIIVF